MIWPRFAPCIPPPCAASKSNQDCPSLKRAAGKTAARHRECFSIIYRCIVSRPRSALSVGICLLLVTVVWTVFGQTLRHDFVNYDDNRYVYENTVVRQGL